MKEDIDKSFERYQTVLDSLIKEYDERLKDFETYEITLKLTFQHYILYFKTPEMFQMELVELAEDSIFNLHFDKEDPAKI